MTEPGPATTKRTMRVRSEAGLNDCRNVLSTIDPSSFEYANLAILNIRECNASHTYSFAEVKCNMVAIAEDDDVPLYFKFIDIFRKGIQVLKEFENNARSFEDYETRAVMMLASYLKDIELHEQSLRRVISVVDNDKKEKKSCESVLTVAFAEHLLGKLSPGNSCTVDIRMRTKGKCSCGFDYCVNEPNYGATGIGDVNAWHGFMDIMIPSDPGLPESVGVAVSTFEDSEDEIDYEDESNEFSSLPGENDIADNKIDLDAAEDQAVAQTIVFSFIQRKRHPTLNTLIPNIMISSSNFRIMMYDSVQDILLCTAPIPLFTTSEKKKLALPAVVILWMVLHHRIFCNGIKPEFINNMEKIRLNFRHLAKDKYNNYLNLTEVGIRHFPSGMKKCYPSRDTFFGGRPLALN